MFVVGWFPLLACPRKRPYWALPYPGALAFAVICTLPAVTSRFADGSVSAVDVSVAAEEPAIASVSVPDPGVLTVRFVPSEDRT
jgi:hypothetical protein